MGEFPSVCDESAKVTGVFVHTGMEAVEKEAVGPVTCIY
jgi:hypothetical protein